LRRARARAVKARGRAAKGGGGDDVPFEVAALLESGEPASRGVVANVLVVDRLDELRLERALLLVVRRPVVGGELRGRARVRVTECQSGRARERGARAGTHDAT
jgi:hypothetical protein